MKKFTSLLISILAISVVYSQHTLTNQINLDLGDTYKYNGYEGTTNIEPGPGGAGQTWDFSDISGYGFFEGINAIAVDPSTTLFADSAVVANANMCTRNMDDPNSGPYQYYDNNNSYSNLIAMGFLGNTNSSFGTYIDEQKAFEFPFGYNDSFVDTYDFWNFHIQDGYYFMRDSATVTVEADAYGTLTTPLQQFHNVLRIKRTKTYYTWFRFTPGGDWMQSGPFTDIEYSWFAPDIKVPVMYVDVMEGFDDYPVRYLVDYNFVTGITDSQVTQIEVFPNPSDNIVHIISNKSIKQVSVTSMQGLVLMVIPSNGLMKQQIDIQNLAAGIYLLCVEYSDNTELSKNILKQ